jgi:hypothetical protein
MARIHSSSPLACQARKAAFTKRYSTSASTGTRTYFVQFSRSHGSFSGNVVT